MLISQIKRDLYLLTRHNNKICLYRNVKISCDTGIPVFQITSFIILTILLMCINVAFLQISDAHLMPFSIYKIHILSPNNCAIPLLRFFPDDLPVSPHCLHSESAVVTRLSRLEGLV